MNGSAQYGSALKQRAHATPAVAPIARAIRAALAVSAAALALSGTVHAADACSSLATDTVQTCGVPGPVDSGSFAPPDDPTTVSDAGWNAAVEAAGIETHPAALIERRGDAAATWESDEEPLVPWTVDDITIVDGGDLDPEPNAVAVAGTFAASTVIAYGPDDAIVYGAVESTDSFTNLANYDAIEAFASAEDGDAFAVGVLVEGWDAATLNNYAAITARAGSDNGDAQAYAAVVDGAYNGGIAVLVNGGDLAAEASAGDGGLAYATGAYAFGSVASVFNDLDSAAIAIAGDGGSATARGARAYASYAAVYNYGSLTADATAGSEAEARGADSFGYEGSSVYNAGNIRATANGDLSSAIGVYSFGQVFSAYTTNTGTILAEARGDAADAFGVLNASAYLGDAITVNQGSISAVAEGGVAAYGEEEAVAFGVYNLAAIYGSVVDNSGSISATALAMADIEGTYGFLQAKSVGAAAINSLGYRDAEVVNSGEIGATAMASQGYASAWGALAMSSGVYGGSASIENTGSIWSYAHADIGVATATGAYARNIVGGAEVVSHGDISAIARSEIGISGVSLNYAYAIGVQALSLYGQANAGVSNYGNILAHASSDGAINGARGIRTYGQYSSITNAADASVVAVGEAEVWGGGFATGIEAQAVYGVDVVNDGRVAAYGYAHAYTDGGTNTHYGASRAIGIYAAAGLQGNVAVTNNGDISATAIADHGITFFNAGAGATGINVYAKYDATVVNAGDITATGISELGITGVYGAIVHGKYSGNLINEAGATISASASVGSLYSDAYGGRAVSFGVQMFGTDYGLIHNEGTIVSHATATPDGGANPSRSLATAFGVSQGAYSTSLTGSVVNRGDIEAVASADFGYATAYGAFVRSQYESTIANAGSLRAAAFADNGDAFAVGSYAYSLHATQYVVCDYNGCDWANATYVTDDGRASLDNGGSITVAVGAQGGKGSGYGAVMLGALAAGITNSGDISVVTDAGDANAVGALANSFYGEAVLANDGNIAAMAKGGAASAIGASLLGESADNGDLAASAHNSGRIQAVADGDVAVATGIVVTSHEIGGIHVQNAGTILAAAYGADATAVAVEMASAAGNILVNSGNIGAFGDGTRIAVSSASSATASIDNRGSLTGAIVTGEFGDRLTNAAGATWRAVGHSDFGAGDDQVINNGLVFMNDAIVSLGDSATGDAFVNAGTLFVSGSGNAIESAALVNNGTISFLDGDTDDVLTLSGGLDGQGSINLDANALDMTSDRLNIGQVADPSAQQTGPMAAQAVVAAPLASQAQTLNVGLRGLPGTANADIALVHVPSAQADDFALGQVSYARDGFVSLDFGLRTSTNPANATETILALSMNVTGLNDAGSLAAAIAPGVQSLVDAQVGTHRQRAATPQMGEAGLSPWLRIFSASGDVDLRHNANFGDGGRFGYHQSTQGWELGLDGRPSESFAVGMLIGKSEGRQSLGGVGNDILDGTTFGLYGTWFGRGGAYVDVSHRWTGIDARLRSSTARFETEASAQALNIEAGYAWATGGGLRLIPQLQYTRTRVADIDTLHGSEADFSSDGGVSSRARVGVALDKTFQTGGFELSPYGSVSVVREFDGEFGHAINGGLQGTTSTEGTSAMLELGLGARRGKLTFSGGVNWTDGGALESVTGGQLAMRYSW